MTMTLYFFPGACSRVTMTALEACGETYEAVPVNLSIGEQTGAAYRAINPKGRVPALRVGDHLLTENLAILFYLNELNPDAGLLPPVTAPVDRQQQLADLAYCSSTLHPLVRQVRNPARLVDGDTAPLQQKGLVLITEQLGRLSARLDSGRWWYGECWSIIDVYLFWAYDIAASAGFDLNAHPALIEHQEKVRSFDPFRRARERELAAAERLGLSFPRGFNL